MPPSTYPIHRVLRNFGIGHLQKYGVLPSRILFRTLDPAKFRRGKPTVARVVNLVYTTDAVFTQSDHMLAVHAAIHINNTHVCCRPDTGFTRLDPLCLPYITGRATNYTRYIHPVGFSGHLPSNFREPGTMCTRTFTSGCHFVVEHDA